MNDGLPGMSIRCIYKDTRGLLWIGTDAGLCSYDGKSFRIYKSKEGMTASKIWAIAEDDDANLWFGSYGDGLYKYDGQHFKQFTKDDGLVSNYVRVLLYSEKYRCLIAGMEGGINTIRGNEITTNPEELFLKEGCTVTGLCDAGKLIYITTYGGVNPIRYYPDKNKFISLNDSGRHYPNHSFSCFLTSKGDTLFSNQNIGIRLFGKFGVISCDTLGQVFSNTEDKYGNIWIAAWSYQNMKYEGGLFRYDGKTFHNFKSAFGITDLEIWTVYYDREQDILWVGTINEGLFKIPFNNITCYPPEYFKIDNQTINYLYIDSDSVLWISGSKELIKLKSDQSFTFLNKRPMILAYRRFWSNPNQMGFPPMGETMKAAKDLQQSNLKKFEEQTNFNFNKLISDTPSSIIYSSELGLFRYVKKTDETIYLGQEGALGDFTTLGDTLIIGVWGPTALNPNYHLDRTKYDNTKYFPTDLFRRFTNDEDPRNVNRLVKRGRQIWYATMYCGLWMSHGMNLINFNKADSTIGNNLNDVCFDESGHVIFGSNTGEICIATYKNQQLKIDFRINGDNGLVGNSVFWLVADQKGKLWAGTNRGLNCIELNDLYTNGKYTIRFFDEEDGYLGQVSRHAVIDANNQLWVGAGKNLIRIKTKDLLENRTETNTVLLSKLEIKNQPIEQIINSEDLSKWNPHPLKKLKLKRTQNDLIFGFDARNYRNPLKDRFRYKLKGYDKNWNEWSENRQAVYTNLPPGDYRLEVESMNVNTGLHSIPLLFEFEVRPYWWEIWYVRLLILGSWIGLMIYVIRKYTELKRTRQQKRLEIEETIVTLELQALQAQMNPHFIFNCVNGIQYYVLANKMDQVLAYLSDFSKVIRESLANANLKTIPLNQEIDFLKSYLRLEQMRFPDKFVYEIRCEQEHSIAFAQIPPMLIQPFIENAIRHGFQNLKEKGNLSVLFQPISNEVLKCTITDNGVGRKNSSQNRPNLDGDRLHSGQITENRIRLFNTPDSTEKYKIVYSDLFDKDEPCGLKVEIYMPIERN